MEIIINPPPLIGIEHKRLKSWQALLRSSSAFLRRKALLPTEEGVEECRGWSSAAASTFIPPNLMLI